MPQRFLRPGITNSERYNAAPIEAQNLFIPRLLSLVDDYGRFDGRASVIWGSAYSVWNHQNPTKQVTLAHVEGMIADLAQAKLIVVYQERGKTVLQFLQWQERIRAGSKEKYPALTNKSKLLQSFGDLQQVLFELLPPSPSPSPSPASTPTPSDASQASLIENDPKDLNARRIKDMTDAEFVSYLSGKPCYAGIDIVREFSKCAVWCEGKGLPAPSRQRLIRWLNKAERPMSGPRGGSMSQPGQQSAWGLQKQIEAIDAQIAEVKKRGFEDATGLQLSAEDLKALRALEVKRSEVIGKLGKLT